MEDCQGQIVGKLEGVILKKIWKEFLKGKTYLEKPDLEMENLRKNVISCSVSSFLSFEKLEPLFRKKSLFFGVEVISFGRMREKI